jgi:hypothetical protein
MEDLGVGARKGSNGIESSSGILRNLTENKTYREWSAVSGREMR